MSSDDCGWLIDAAELLAQGEPPAMRWLVEDLIPDGAFVAAVGRWKTTKSYGLLDICISVAAGEPVFGALDVDQGPVVFVNEESGREALWRRLDALCRGRAINPERLRGQLQVAANARIKLDDHEWQQRLLELRPRLFVFDPLARMKAAERDENVQADMAVLIEFIRYLRDHTGAAVCIVHHVGHGGDGHMRGSSDLESAWETRLTWRREGQSPEVTITAEHREAEASAPVRYRIGWDHDTGSMRFELNHGLVGGRDLEAEIAAYLEEHPQASTNAIAAGLSAGKKTVADLLKNSAQFVAINGPRGAKLWLPATTTQQLPSDARGSAGKSNGRVGTLTSPTAPIGASEGSQVTGPPTSLTEFSNWHLDENELERLIGIGEEEGLA